MERVNIMITRIVEQMATLTRLKSTGTVRASARPVEFSLVPDQSPGQQVNQIAGIIAEMVLNDLSTMNGFNSKENNANAN
jgi:hypothetical protein